jgi:hypothetical protein
LGLAITRQIVEETHAGKLKKAEELSSEGRRELKGDSTPFNWRPLNI